MRAGWPFQLRTRTRGPVGAPAFMMAEDSTRSPAAEAFRNLRTNLQFASLGGPLSCIVITAAGPEEGKSTVVANLAVAMAQGGSKVLAVGADLRRPSLHHAFGLSNSKGLTSVLLGRMTPDEAIQHADPWGIDVLAAGPIPPNPAELLGSARMKELLEELRTRWTTVLIDTPPAVALSDAALLAARADGVLVIVTARQTPREMVLATRRQLEQVGARILGVVVNRVRPESAHYHYYYYYYSHDGAARDGGARASRNDSRSVRER